MTPWRTNFLGSITVVGLKKDGQNEYYKPYQAYIAQKLYPLTRDIVINIREGRAGLGTGFTSFVAGEKRTASNIESWPRSGNGCLYA